MEMKFRITSVEKYKHEDGPRTVIAFEPLDESSLPKFGRKREYYPPQTVVDVPYKLYYDGYTSHNPGEIITVTISYD